MGWAKKEETQPSVWKTPVVFHFAFAAAKIAKEFDSSNRLL